MNTNINFEERIYKYGLNIIHLVQKLPKNDVSGVLGKQLLRSGTSVSANFTEAKAASSKKDYANFYSYALKSANESVLWVKYLRDSRIISKEEAEKIIDETEQIAKILAASILTMRRKSS